MIDLTQFLGSTSTVGAPLNYSFNGNVQPNSSAVFLVRAPQVIILFGKLVLGLVPISGTLSLSTTSSGDGGRIVYTPTSGGASMSQNVSFQVSGNVLTLTPTVSVIHGDPDDDLEKLFKETLDAITYFTIQPVPGTGSETNTQLFADVAGLSATTVLVPAS